MKMSKPLFDRFRLALAGEMLPETSIRQRWDALHRVDRTFALVNAAYAEGLNDDHIDTALRHVVQLETMEDSQ